MKIEELVDNYPILYHMAEAGSWENVKRHGLHSTSSLLNLYKVTGNMRVAIESHHRPESVKIECDGLPGAVVRDQKPMSDSALRKVLLDNLQPSDWYKILNSKVFFWSSRKKVHTLLNARAYRNRAHDVITVDTSKLVEKYHDRIVLCPYNSGSTIMNPVERGRDLFRLIKDYDYYHWKQKRGKAGAVTEVCVEGAVEDIMSVVIDVWTMKGNDCLVQLHP